MILFKKYATKLIATCALFVFASAVYSQVTGNVPRPIPVPTVTSITGSTPVVVTPTGTVFDIKLQPCAVGQVLQWSATPLPAGYKCATLAAPVIDLYRDRGMPNTLMTLSGVASFSRTDFLKWTSKFFILGGGRGAGTLSSAGYYEIGMPPVGTVIQGIGGVPNQTVSATGINMRASAGSWSVLYYILNAGGQATVNANFRLAGWQTDFAVPDNWVMVAAYNADVRTVKIGNGQILVGGADSTGAITPFDATVDFNQVTPTTAGVTFTPKTPASSAVLYVSSVNGSQWTFNGTAYVAAPALPGWQTVGNAGTVQATNFIGTTDNIGFSIRTNNQIRQTITNSGLSGWGTTTPTNRVHSSNAGLFFNPTANDRASIKVEGSYGGGIAFAEGANRALIWAGNGDTLSFSTGGTAAGAPERVRILANGNLGVNAPGATEKLEVGGNIRATGVPNFATTASAIASTLLPGTMYTVTTGSAKTLYIK